MPARRPEPVTTSSPALQAGAPSPAAASESRRGLAAVVAGALCIAASPILVRLSELEPTATGFHRVFLAAPLFALWVLAIERRKRAHLRSAGRVTEAPADASVGLSSGRTGGRPAAGTAVTPSRPSWALVVLAGLIFAADLAAWHWSLKYTTVANSTFIANLAPVFVTALAWFFLRERVTRVFLVGLLIAIAGASLMVRAGFDVDSSHLLGDGLALATSLSYAGYLVSVKGLRRRLSTARLMLYTSLVTSAALLALSLAAGESLIPRTLRGFLIVLALAWVSQALGQGLIAFGMAHVPASFSSVSLLLQPVAAALLAWVVLGEAVSWWQGLGGVGVLAGIVVARAGTAQSPAARMKEGRPV